MEYLEHKGSSTKINKRFSPRRLVTRAGARGIHLRTTLNRPEEIMQAISHPNLIRALDFFQRLS